METENQTELTEEQPLSEEMVGVAPSTDNPPADDSPAIAPGEQSEGEGDDAQTPDYERMAREDLAAIVRMCPEYACYGHLSEIPFSRRFAELRQLGLTAEEALGAVMRKGGKGSKGHLRTVSPRAGTDRAQGMSAGEMRAARELFGDRLSDREITELYRRATR